MLIFNGVFWQLRLQRLLRGEPLGIRDVLQGSRGYRTRRGIDN